MKTVSIYSKFVTTALLAGVLTACSESSQTEVPVTTDARTPASSSNENKSSATFVVCGNCGVVYSITPVEVKGEGTGIGAALGAIVGGLAGNQVGGGTGKKLATVAGAVGGAVAGNTLEKNRNANLVYEVVINMENGGQQVITVPDAYGVSVGSSVAVESGNIVLR